VEELHNHLLNYQLLWLELPGNEEHVQELPGKGIDQNKKSDYNIRYNPRK
jgi:hypothetical protein